MRGVMHSAPPDFNKIRGHWLNDCLNGLYEQAWAAYLPAPGPLSLLVLLLESGPQLPSDKGQPFFGKD